MVRAFYGFKPRTLSISAVNLMTGDPDVISKIIHEQRNHVDATVNHLKHQLQEHKVKSIIRWNYDYLRNEFDFWKVHGIINNSGDFARHPKYL